MKQLRAHLTAGQRGQLPLVTLADGHYNTPERRRPLSSSQGVALAKASRNALIILSQLAIRADHFALTHPKAQWRSSLHEFANTLHQYQQMAAKLCEYDDRRAHQYTYGTNVSDRHTHAHAKKTIILLTKAIGLVVGYHDRLHQSRTRHTKRLAVELKAAFAPIRFSVDDDDTPRDIFYFQSLHTSQQAKLWIRKQRTLQSSKTLSTYRTMLSSSKKIKSIAQAVEYAFYGEPSASDAEQCYQTTETSYARVISTLSDAKLILGTGMTHFRKENAYHDQTKHRALSEYILSAVNRVVTSYTACKGEHSELAKQFIQALTRIFHEKDTGEDVNFEQTKLVKMLITYDAFTQYLKSDGVKSQTLEPLLQKHIGDTVLFYTTLESRNALNRTYTMTFDDLMTWISPGEIRLTEALLNWRPDKVDLYNFIRENVFGYRHKLLAYFTKHARQGMLAHYDGVHSVLTKLENFAELQPRFERSRYLITQLEMYIPHLSQMQHALTTSQEVDVDGDGEENEASSLITSSDGENSTEASLEESDVSSEEETTDTDESFPERDSADDLQAPRERDASTKYGSYAARVDVSSAALTQSGASVVSSSKRVAQLSLEAPKPRCPSEDTFADPHNRSIEFG